MKGTKERKKEQRMKKEAKNERRNKNEIENKAMKNKVRKYE